MYFKCDYSKKVEWATCEPLNRNGVRGGAPENFGFFLFEWPNFVSPGDLNTSLFVLLLFIHHG